jgi:CheY-like chemotaxis protein
VLRILLAEDNLADILLVQKALEEHRITHELHVVRDGAEALAFLARVGQPGQIPCPDVVLLDLNLPKVDGPTVLSAVRRHPHCVHTPVVVVTSSDAERDRARMAELGATRYFKKPTDLDSYLQLGAVVREVAGERRRGKA